MKNIKATVLPRSLSNPIVASAKVEELLCYEFLESRKSSGNGDWSGIAGVVVVAQYGAYNGLIEAMQFRRILFARGR